MVNLILDASAFLSGMFSSTPKGFEKVLTTSSIRGEIGRGRPSKDLENMISTGLKIMDPSEIERAREAATKTGDIGSLSDADISVIALAMEVGDVIVVTDDFRVQNVLKSVGIRFEPAGELGSRTIKEIWTWTYRCSGCGRYFDKAQKNDDCPVCGSLVRKKKKQ